MSLEKRVKLAGRILKIQLATSYLLYFLVIGAVTVNMFFLSNWWARMLPPEMYPIPVNVQNTLGLILLLTLMIFQSILILSLYLVKKEKQSKDCGLPPKQ
ncbi:MAG: hypothetical protein QXW47_08500 [Candidatus Jordarchaeales archaeon]|nr:hypothetical protein [Candidatus Jordarchaeia archaeon]